MKMERAAERGLVLLGCGRMGSAMLEGWIAGGLPPASVWALDPEPSARLERLVGEGLTLNAGLPEAPAAAVIAVKPQMMREALPSLNVLPGDSLFVSVAAGTPIRVYEEAFGPAARIVRAMPNTPAAIGQGITAILGNARAGAADLDFVEGLLRAVGEVVRLDAENQMDAVTAVSGSGPAYVFHLIETMSSAGVAEGLPRELATRLALATVAGAGALALETGQDPSRLRADVTSPGGTTAAALEHLMDPDAGFPPLLKRAVAAAAERGRELAQ